MAMSKKVENTNNIGESHIILVKDENETVAKTEIYDTGFYQLENST